MDAIDVKLNDLYIRILKLSHFGIKINFEAKNGKHIDPFDNDPEDKNETLELHWGDSVDMIEAKIAAIENKYAACEDEFKQMHFIKLLNKCKSK